MKKQIFTTMLAALALAGSVEARQIVDKTNNFYVNLPDRYLLEVNANADNKFVVLNAYDPEDDSSFIIKISPSKISEINGMALDNERTKFRDSLIKMGLEPYVEGILYVAPAHESIYTFSKLDDQGEILNYLMAKFWAHNQEYAFYCIQPTKTLRTQEFLDTIDSFKCMKHQNPNLPRLQMKERPEYDKAKEQHDDLLKKANLEAKKLLAEGKKEEAEKILAAVPKFEEKPAEYLTLVEINGPKPLPKDITDRVAHEALYSEHPEQVYAKYMGKNLPLPNKQDALGNKPVVQSKEPSKENTFENSEVKPEIEPQQPTKQEEQRSFITPPPIQKSNGITIIRNGKASQDLEFQPEPERKLSKEEIREMEKMKKEQAKFEKEQAKRQAKLDRLRKKELEKAEKAKRNKKD